MSVYNDLMLPGDRIIAARIAAGFNTRKAFYRHLKAVNMEIAYKRLGRIERSMAVPSPYEIDAFRAALGISADCLMSGICDTLSDQLNNQAGKLSGKQFRMFYRIAIENAKIIKEEDE